MAIDLSDPTVAAAVIGGSVALFGSVLAVASAVVTLTVNKRAKYQELAIDALEFLGGGTQKRAIGIALAEHLGRDPHLRKMLLPVLQAQRIYLQKKLGEPEGTDDVGLEEYNLERLKAVIDRFAEPGSENAPPLCEDENTRRI